MAVIFDLGENNNLHPTNKHEVGRRLALAAKKIAYNQEVVYSGPLYQSMLIDGDKLILEFTHTGSGMTTKNNLPLHGFDIAGEDMKFYRAEAHIAGNKVVVFSPEVSAPAAVRYAWANSPVGNLQNKEGLPASPFRTDSWKEVTDDNK